MRTYYKVVGGPSSNYPMCSVCKRDDFPSKYRVKYSIDEWTQPNVENTRIFIFKTLGSAYRFLDKYDWSSQEASIYECHAKGVGTPRHIPDIDYISMFWNLKRLKRKLVNIYYMTLPSGTKTASEVKLIKKVF